MIKNPFQRKIEDEFDFDFHLDTNIISTLDGFERNILKPYESGKRIFYRGERVNRADRPLLPTLFRDKDKLISENRFVSLVDSEFICDYYRKMPAYYNLYSDIIGEISPDNLYPFLAFSQHYLGISPLIDFSKSPYPAMSFALKDRKTYDEDIMLYTLEIKDDTDYTDNVLTANRWLNDYGVVVMRDNARLQLNFELDNPFDAIAEYRKIHERFSGSTFLELNAPSAKLIDVPTNDLMTYQQGVFLLLNHFSLMGKSYLTKQIRDDFSVTKWLINKDICPDLLDLLLTKYPYYSFEYITNLNKIAKALKNG